METPNLRHFLALFECETIPEILFERAAGLSRFTWGPDGDLATYNERILPKWLQPKLHEEYDAGRGRSGKSELKECLLELSALSSRHHLRSGIQSSSVENTIFDILFTVIQALPEPYTEILWQEAEAGLWNVVEATCIPFLAVLDISDVERYAALKEGSISHKLRYLVPFIKFNHRILAILKKSSPPSIPIITKQALYILQKEQLDRKQKLDQQAVLEVHNLEVVDEALHLLINHNTDSWARLERLYRTQHNERDVASIEFTIASVYANEPTHLYALTELLGIVDTLKTRKWVSMQTLAKTQVLRAQTVVEAAWSVWSSLPLTVQILAAFRALHNKDAVTACQILESAEPKVREAYKATSQEYLVAGTQLVFCYNATQREKLGAQLAEDMVRAIWPKRPIPRSMSENVVLARSARDLYLFMAYTDALIGLGDFEPAKRLLANLTQHQASSDTFTLLCILRLLKIYRREKPHDPHLDSWNWLEKAIGFLNSAPSNLLYQCFEEATCMLSTVDGLDTTQIARAKDVVDALDAIDITRFDGPKTMKLTLLEYRQELQIYRKDLGLFSATGPQLHYCRNIREGFPNASISFIERIGAANWERFQRLKETPVFDEVVEPTIVAREPSKFHDSGVGTSLQRTDTLPVSIPPARSRASKLSFNTVFDPSLAALPDIPTEILAGKPYNCTWCGRDLKMDHPKRQWPQHVYADLRPYICIMEDCKLVTPFGSQAEYEQHLATHEFIVVLACEICDHIEHDIHQLHRHCRTAHRAESMIAAGKPKLIPRDLNKQQCPFCGEVPGAKHFVRHVSRHCEEVALSSLSQALNEGSESGCDSDDGSGYKKNEGEPGEVQDYPEMHDILHRYSEDEERDQHKSDAERHPDRTHVYNEGDDVITENEDVEVLTTKASSNSKEAGGAMKKVEEEAPGYKNLMKRLGFRRPKVDHKEGPALAYKFGNTIIVEDEDGEVAKTYELPATKQNTEGGGSSAVRQGLARMGTWTGITKRQQDSKTARPASQAESSAARQGIDRMGKWGFGRKDNDGPGPPRPVELPMRTNHPSTSHQSRTASLRPPPRPKASHGDHPKRRITRQRDSRRPLYSEHRVQKRISEVEELTDDRTIIRRFHTLGVFIEQHVEYFFPRNIPSNQETKEFDDPRTRHPNIRQYLAQTIISRIVEPEGNSLLDISAIAREIFAYLAPYSNTDEEREDHLIESCRRGNRLRNDIDHHPSLWTFDFSSTKGYIVMVPALIRDGEEVLPSQMFKID